VNSLIEMLADDVALRTESKATLIKAIAIVASGSAVPQAAPAMGAGGLPGASLQLPDGAGGSGSASTTASRVSRLLSPRAPLPAALRATVVAVCVLLLAMPTALLIVPGLLG